MVKPLAAAVALSVLLPGLGCGGGGSKDAPPPTPAPTKASITGTVAGTTAIAFNAAGAEVARSVAAGAPRRFTLTVPPGAAYRIFLVEGEGTPHETVYPLYQGSANVFQVATAATVDLGFVETASGVARPTNDPTAVAGVTAAGEDRSVPPALAATAATLADLAGTWNFVGLVTGNGAGQRPGWTWGSYAVTTAGGVSFTAPITDSLGSAPYTPGPFTFDVSLSRVVTIPGVPAAGYHGVLSPGRDLLVSVATMAPGRDTGPSGYNLQIAVKAGASYATADLAGPHHYLGVIAGVPRPGWYWGTYVSDAAGAWTFPTPITDSMGTLGYTPTGTTVAVSADGILTLPSFPGLVHGLVSRDKNLSALVATVAPGRDTGVSGDNLQFGFRKPSGVTLADLAGRWRIHMLVTGSGTQYQGWAHGTCVAGAAGDFIIETAVKSDGGTGSGGGNLSVTSDGVVTMNVGNSARGVLGAGKDVMVMTMNDGGGGYDLVVFQR